MSALEKSSDVIISRQEQYILRFPAGMRQRVKSAAERNFRTMNAEILYQLTRAYGADETEEAPARS